MTAVYRLWIDHNAVWESGSRGDRCYVGENARIMALVWKYATKEQRK
jgi:hypothetical protein